MGGAVKKVTNTVKSVGGDIIHNPLKGITRFGADMMTFGGNELLGNPVGKLMDVGRNPSASVPQLGQMSPLDMLSSSGGAPLLTNISLGVKPDDALASYFGIQPADWKNWLSTRSPSEQEAISGLSSTLNQVSTNTELRNKAVTQLTNDFPDYMASAIPKYKNIADQATLSAAQQALDQTAAKYASGGQLSSGATAAAMARTGAETAQGNLAFGGNLALQDWTNKYNSASALQSFQQKMLGQGATQGFNAVQNALQQNNNNSMANKNNAMKQNEINQSGTNSMMGALGGLAGTALGGYFMGPMGAMAGGGMAKFNAPKVAQSNDAGAGMGA